MSTTTRKDNEGDAVEFETVTNTIETVSGSYPTTTTRTDNTGDPVEVTMVIHTSRKECR